MRKPCWVEQEYHRTPHSEMGATPLARYLAGPSVRRDCPAPTVLADAFRVEVARRQRRADGTVTLHGHPHGAFGLSGIATP